MKHTFVLVSRSSKLIESVITLSFCSLKWKPFTFSHKKSNKNDVLSNYCPAISSPCTSTYYLEISKKIWYTVDNVAIVPGKGRENRNVSSTELHFTVSKTQNRIYNNEQTHKLWEPYSSITDTTWKLNPQQNVSYLVHYMFVMYHTKQSNTAMFSSLEKIYR